MGAAMLPILFSSINTFSYLFCFPNISNQFQKKKEKKESHSTAAGSMAKLHAE